MSTQTIFRVVNPNKSYTKLSNTLLGDRALSFECKGFLVSILMLPADWAFNVTWLTSEFGIGRDKAYALIREAGKAGYCHKFEHRAKSGRITKVEYHFSDDPADFPINQPLPEKPEVGKTPLPEKATSGSAASGESGRIQRTDNNKQLTITNNPLSPPSGEKSPKRQLSELPQDWGLPHEWFVWAHEYAPRAWPDLSARIYTEADVFRDYWRGEGKRKKDWHATWRNWWRRYCERNTRNGHSYNGHMTNFDRKIEGARRCEELLARREEAKRITQ